MADRPNALKGEVWKPVYGYEGFYEVSSFGRVWSLPRPRVRSGVVLRPALDRAGYPRVALLGKTKKVHRLVLEAFQGPAPPGHEGAHIDGNPANARLDNLAWKTSRENKEDQRSHGTMRLGERHQFAKLSDDDVRRIRRLRSSGLTWKEIHDDYPQVARHTLVGAGTGKTFRHIVDVPPSGKRRRGVSVNLSNGGLSPGVRLGGQAPAGR